MLQIRLSRVIWNASHFEAQRHYCIKLLAVGYNMGSGCQICGLEFRMELLTGGGEHVRVKPIIMAVFLSASRKMPE